MTKYLNFQSEDKNKAMNKNGLPPNIANNRPIPEVPGAYRIKELQITIGKIGYLPYI